MWTFITGTPTNLSNFLKYGISFQSSGRRSFRISTDRIVVYQQSWKHSKLNDGDRARRIKILPGVANTYASPLITLPLFSKKLLTLPSSFSSIFCILEFSRTSPPRNWIWSTIGLQSLSGGLPSKKAIFEPCFSCWFGFNPSEFVSMLLRQLLNTRTCKPSFESKIDTKALTSWYHEK